MTPHPQQQYIITEKELTDIQDAVGLSADCEISHTICQEAIDKARSRPIPAEPEVSECRKFCPESNCFECKNRQRKETINEMLQKSQLNLLKEHDAAIAAQAREDVLNEIQSKVQDEEQFFGTTIYNEEVYYLTGKHIRRIIESIRHQEP